MEQRPRPRKERKGAQGYRKVKTGCRTCRVRHKKCDERKPACSQCITAGWQCDFLGTSMAISRAPPHRVTTLPQEPSSTVWGATTLDPVDVWNFEYFRVVYTKRLTLYLRTNLWEKLILQAAPTERYILDGAVAIGALSRNLVPSENPRRSAFMPGHPIGYSLHKYNLAMKELRLRLTSQPRNSKAALLGSLIFIAFELEQGGVDAARVHLDSALAILNGTDGSLFSDQQMRADMGHILDAFTCLDVQSLRAPQCCPLVGLPTLPSTFEGINEARDSLNVINGVVNSVFQKWTYGSELHQTPTPPMELSQDIPILLSYLESWRKAFATLDIRETPDSKTAACALSLLMVYETIYILTSTFLTGNETAYDLHLARFACITQLADELLNKSDFERIAALESASGPQFDLAVVQPLFFVACKCRDAGIRRKAVRMMARTKIGGLYDTRLQIKAACWVIGTEEGGTTRGLLSHHVREENRLRDLRLDIDDAAESCQVSAWTRGTDGQLCDIVDVVYLQ